MNQVRQKINNSILTGIIFTAVIFSVMYLTGCSKNDSVMGPNMNQQVSFQISQRTTISGDTEFMFKPNIDINISKIVSRFESQPFRDTLSFTNTAYVYSKDTTYIIDQYTGVQNGQQWNFDFTGSVPGQTNSNYSVTSNYTAQ